MKLSEVAAKDRENRFHTIPKIDAGSLRWPSEYESDRIVRAF